jgi:sugar phosphate permease
MSAAPDSLAGQRPHYRWVILVVLFVSYVVVFLARLSVGPLAPFFRDELDITSAQVGMVLSAAAFGYMVTQIPLGWVTDRIGARWPIGGGAVLAGLSLLGVSSSPSHSWMLGWMLLTGMACGFLMPSTTQAVVVWFPRRERATVMGVKQSAVNIGGIVGAVTLPAIAITFGWRGGFRLIGLLAIAVGVTSFGLYRNPVAPPLDPTRAADPGGGPLRRLLKSRDVWLVALAGLFLNWVEMAMLGHFVLYLTDALAIPVVRAGATLATAEVAGAFARPGSGLLSDWLFRGRRKPVFLLLAIIATTGCLVFALAGPRLDWLLLPVTFATGIGAVGFGAICFTMLSEFGGRGGAGTASALGSTIGMVGSIVGPIAFGYIVDLSGSYAAAWWSQTFVGSMAIVALLLVREDTHHI